MSKPKAAPIVIKSTELPRPEPHKGHPLSVSFETPAPAPRPAAIGVGIPVPLSECIGKRIECPTCGAEATVDHARGAKDKTRIISSRWWVLVRCKGHCGSSLRKIVDTAKLLPDPTPEIVRRPLGEVVGRFIKCPTCEAKSRAQWTVDDGHVIECPVHQVEPYPPETIVEVIA